MSEAIPVGWQRRSLSSLGEYENGFAFNELHWSEHGLPIVRIAQITGTQGIVDRYPGRLPDTFRIDSGDLIFSWSGTLAVVRWAGGPAWLNQHLFKVVPAPGIDRSLLFHVLQASVAEMNKRTHGSTMKHIKRGELREFFVSIPVAVDEQRRLASVLDTLDTAIHETEAIIAKLKAVKQGLLHDLLTRGIDANGELRPPQAEAPHLYKQSPLGWIPKEWNAPRLLDVSNRITDGTHEAVTTVADGGGEVPFLFVSCVRDGEVAWDKAASITRRDYVRISKGREPEPGMVLYTAVGSYGHAAEVGDKREFAFQRHIACIYPDATQVIAGFMPFVLNWEPMQRYADRVALGNAQKTVTLGELSRYPFVCPKKTEQVEIVGRVRAVQEKLTSEQRCLEKLQLQKSGLMDDLLTGRVRVTPLLEGGAP
ncbi:restriction endonuclease subunit S [Methylocaldum sp. GT1BB]|jgi:type I restriction enzyme S subunit|uniref:restriction endonuclease subunit S n=1 Tax=Methylocaldum sp. GT1BB TaxID=3438963 RepID=UPI003DA0F42F